MADEANPPDWTPEKEREEDPAKIQKEYVDVARETLSILRTEQERQAKREAERLKTLKEVASCQPAPPPGLIAAYVPPLLSEILDRYETVWRAIDERFDDPVVKEEVFRALMHQQFRLADGQPAGDESVSA